MEVRCISSSFLNRGTHTRNDETFLELYPLTCLLRSHIYASGMSLYVYSQKSSLSCLLRLQLRGAFAQDAAQKEMPLSCFSSRVRCFKKFYELSECTTKILLLSQRKVYRYPSQDHRHVFARTD